MERIPEEQWRAWRARWQRSGESMVAFAAEVGVKVSAMGYWFRRLRQEAEAKAKEAESSTALAPARSRSGRRRRSSPEVPPLTLVELAVPPSPSAASASLEVVVSDLVIRVPRGFDEETLSRLLGVARRTS